MNESCTSSVGDLPAFPSVRSVVLACLAIASSAAFAQSNPPSPGSPDRATRVPTSAEVASARPAATSDSSESNPTQEELVLLSPFEVRGEEDTGYQAMSTMAGTRLRSDLKDLAGSISIVTKDFLIDVNATDLTSLLTHTPGTEVAGQGGNFSGLSAPEAGGNYNDALGQAVPATRSRGLLGMDRTRDYFLTDVPMDSYNWDRVEISRGANAMLFGLGSPAGVINTSLIKADTRKNFGTVNAQYGSYGSYRGTLDYNASLIKNKLALRVATVYGDTKYRVEDAFERKKAITLTGTYRPFENTVIRSTTEWGRSDSNRPEQRPAYDSFSWWWKAGKPVWDPTTNSGRLLGTPEAPFTTTSVFNANGTRNTGLAVTSASIGGFSANLPGIFYLDPNSDKIGGLDIGGGVLVDGVKGFATNGFLFPGATTLGNGGMIGFQTSNLIIGNIYHAQEPLLKSFYGSTQLTDPNIFDFYHHMLGGPTKYEWSEWKTYSGSIEQTFFNKRAGIELAFDADQFDTGFVSPGDYTLNLDINEKLPNGSPNPNFLRPVIASGGFKRAISKDRNAYRATGYYDLDLRKTGPKWLGKVLGRHMFNANYMDQEYRYQVLGGTLWNSNLDWVSSEGQTLPGTASSTGRIVAVVNYLGPSVLNAASPGDASVQALTAAHDPSGVGHMTILNNKRPATTAATALAPWTPATFGLVTNSREGVEGTVRSAAGYADRTKTQVHSASGVVQSHWLENIVVSTVGWRRDQVWTYDAGLAMTDPGSGTAITDPDVFFPKKVSAVSEESTNWGVVVHTPQFIARHLPLDSEISLLYNDSSNFRVQAQRIDILGRPIGAEIGTTKEYGLRLTTFKGKLEFKWAHYKTSDDLATITNGGFTGGVNLLGDLAGNVIERSALGNNVNNPAGIAAFEAWLNGPYGQIYQHTFNYSLTPNTDPSKPVATWGKYATSAHNRGQVAATSALTSEGDEFEVIYNPLRNWRISASVTSQDAVRTNIAPELLDFLLNGTNGLLPLVQNANGSATTAGGLSTTSGSGNTTLQVFALQSVLNQTLPTFLQDGSKVDELAHWSYRATTNFSFTKDLFGGVLDGWSLGGSVAWQDRKAIGYPAIVTTVAGQTLGAPDVAHPFFGPRRAVVDLNIGYHRRLTRKIDWNVRLYLANVGVGNELIPLHKNPDGATNLWQIADPQKWTLSNTFSF